jgi:single-strand DNA-binding protein
MINKAVLIGNLGKDPEVRYTATGTAIATFSVATTDSWKDRESGEVKKDTEWHRIVCFGRVAEIAGEYLHKGKQVYIEGKIQYRSWETDDGEKKYITEIKAHIVKFLGGAKGKKASEDDSYGSSNWEDDDIPF